MRDTNDNECLVRRIAMRDAGFNYSFPPGIASYCQVLPPGITKNPNIMNEATCNERPGRQLQVLPPGITKIMSEANCNEMYTRQM